MASELKRQREAMPIITMPKTESAKMPQEIVIYIDRHRIGYSSDTAHVSQPTEGSEIGNGE